ncbi:glycoside hydrolase family 28 protein [Glonium stellatum]|uniref:Glycoside hydrolase family 28 protein n=1 Tax=Glonium stellatum TaxID=574774 RepID=A0A8E2JMC7_9PEZI|nr:glycoside hydrolase family 28 protein [Glonium stellatum]
MKSLALLTAAALLAVTAGQLTGSVGPTTSITQKRAKKVCNVLSYGAKADKSTDLGPAIQSAWQDCKSGGVVYIPSGEYAMSTWQTLSGGASWALQLDGIIYRTGTSGGHMIIIENTNDFELFSQTSQGAIQGYGYTFLSQGNYGPRLIRLVNVVDFSFHDLMLVDSPAFHLILATCKNGEVYNSILRGANRGGLDGIDVSGSNIYIHDVEVTNKDECVTIKSPAANMLVENIYCNWSGGCAIGSLSTGTAISSIKYNNIYTWQSNQMLMIKSSGGSGYVRDCSFTNFIGHSNAYALDIDQYWSSQSVGSGSGVQLSDLTVSDWKGTIIDPKRAAINMVCADGAPCTNISLSNLAFWSDSGAAIHYTCRSAYGQGYCLHSGSGSSYSAASSTVSSAPAGYNGPKMGNDLASGLGISRSIDIPTSIPTSFFPGATPLKPLLNGSSHRSL